ncbi:MAG: hypothetical protein DMG20_09115 [Acidobacteria bacterium]|nr:MAG: hypothetical protein DMG20_09115 [Acidobacteriota bacterium]
MAIFLCQDLDGNAVRTLYLKEAEVEQLVTLPEVISALERAFLDQAAGRAWTNPRNRLHLPGVTLHMMAGAIPGYFGYKAYTVSAGKALWRWMPSGN